MTTLNEVIGLWAIIIAAALIIRKIYKKQKENDTD